MMRKFTYYLLAFFAIFFVNGCNEEDVSSPPSSSFTVDKHAGLSDDTEFTFVIDQVGAKSIALLPYGTDHASLGGILVTSFTDGKATVKFKYTEVGTFQAVVVTSNYSSDGEQIKRSYSAEETITITSDKAELKTFKFEKSTKDSIADDNSVWVTVPFGSDITKLKAFFTTTPFSTVKVGATTQVTEVTENNFTGTVIYTVSSQDESNDVDYDVHVSVTPQETDATVKKASAKSIGKSTKDKVFPAYVDNAGGRIIILLTSGLTDADKDSLRFSYEMNGAFAKMEEGPDHSSLEVRQDTLINLNPAADAVGFITLTEDSADVVHDYTIEAAVAPTLKLSFTGLDPVVNGTTTDYDISLKVLDGTSLTAVPTTALVSGGAASIISMQVTKANGVAFSSGQNVNFSGDPVKFTVLVNDDNLGIYEVIFTAKVTVLK